MFISSICSIFSGYPIERKEEHVILSWKVLPRITMTLSSQGTMNCCQFNRNEKETKRNRVIPVSSKIFHNFKRTIHIWDIWERYTNDIYVVGDLMTQLNTCDYNRLLILSQYNRQICECDQATSFSDQELFHFDQYT